MIYNQPTVVHGVHTIDTHMHDMPRYNAAYIMDFGGKTVMVDAGLPHKWKYTMEEIRNAGFDPGKIDYLFITHDHGDHYGAAGFIAQLNPDITIFCSLGVAESLLKDNSDDRIKQLYKSDKMRKSIGNTIKVPAKNIRIIDNNETIDINGHRIKAYYTPGHRDGNTSYHYLNHNIIFCSDLVQNYFVDVGVHYSLYGLGTNYQWAISSLKFLKEKYPAWLALGHYGFTDDVNKVIDDAVNLLQGVLDNAKKIMEENQNENQLKLVEEMYLKQAYERVGAFKGGDDSLGRGDKVYAYATEEHIPPQGMRFAKACAELYFPELAYKG